MTLENPTHVGYVGTDVNREAVVEIYEWRYGLEQLKKNAKIKSEKEIHFRSQIARFRK